MLEMTPQNAERWEKTRRLGRRRFIGLFGVLGWGLSLAAFTTILFHYSGTDIDEPGIIYPAGWVLALIGGYFWGACVWWLMEKRYAAARQRQPEAGAPTEKTVAPTPGSVRLG